MTISETPPAGPADTELAKAVNAEVRRSTRADLVTSGGALGLITLASVVGGVLYVAGHPVHATSAPPPLSGYRTSARAHPSRSPSRDWWCGTVRGSRAS